MLTDRYSKFVLSLIAACLSLLTLKAFGVLPEAHAQSDQAVRVTLCDPSGRYCGDDWIQFVIVRNPVTIEMPRR